MTTRADDGCPPAQTAWDLAVNASLSAFVCRGYCETAMSDIADAAGVSKGTLYQMFKSKRDLFHQCLISKIIDENEEVLTVFAPKAVAEDVEMFLRLQFRLFLAEDSSLNLFRVMGSVPELNFEQIFFEQRLLPAIAKCEALLSRQAGLATINDDVKRLAYTIMLSVTGLCIQATLKKLLNFADAEDTIHTFITSLQVTLNAMSHDRQRAKNSKLRVEKQHE
ncbi:MULTISPECIES: TetR/AcrR family transcriptional regulator [Rhizobium/Agrobacterium group]|uniref:TetR/AcrR family transcriptional regulator n=1 Tax=Rhizobium/Agrobacterium group TaxID=227290 RepID=UPI00107FA276|nr:MULTISPECIES: TetR/AcrR family transcriptional regulator [Rhizobium/Agrobacterium group]MBB4403161.1 AcrR family transcriptional regulator [Agrobacterium radiobacter]MBB5588929.1 AcrR family transcriptional regulator [Agrobacterium radiobacter]TGE86524.1 hypothetical protein C9418_22625 [Rhizobium sp. SEMIA 4032]